MNEYLKSKVNELTREELTELRGYLDIKLKEVTYKEPTKSISFRRLTYLVAERIRRDLDVGVNIQEKGERQVLELRSSIDANAAYDLTLEINKKYPNFVLSYGMDEFWLYRVVPEGSPENCLKSLLEQAALEFSVGETRDAQWFVDNLEEEWLVVVGGELAELAQTLRSMVSDGGLPESYFKTWVLKVKEVLLNE